MGQSAPGQKGLQGPEGLKGKQGPPGIRGTPGKDGKDGKNGLAGDTAQVNWDALTNTQTNEIINKLKTTYEDSLRPVLTENDKNDILTNLKTDLPRILLNQVTSNNTFNIINKTKDRIIIPSSNKTIQPDQDIMYTLADTVSKSDNRLSEFVSQTATSGNLLKNISNKIISTNKLYTRLANIRNEGLKDGDLDRQLIQRTLWCADGDLCSVPLKNKGTYKSYGLNLINDDTLSKAITDTTSVWGGKIRYSVDIISPTEGNALHIEGLGTRNKFTGVDVQNRKISFLENIETGTGTIGKLLAGNYIWDGGNKDTDIGGYIQLGLQTGNVKGSMKATYKNYDNTITTDTLLDAVAYISNVPEKGLDMNYDTTYNTDWVRLLSDKDDLNSLGKGFAAKNLKADDTVQSNNKFKIGDWEITQDSNSNLIFKNGGVIRLKLGNNGNNQTPNTIHANGLNLSNGSFTQKLYINSNGKLETKK